MSPDRGNAYRLLIAFVALILYASFYPFQANWARLSNATLYWNGSTVGDRVINVLAYMPLGLLLVACGRGPVAATVLGFALSFAVEFGQNATRHRNPNVYDLLTNGLGTALGALLCTPGIQRRIAGLRLIDLASPAGLLTMLWFAIHSVPLIAVIEPDKLHTTYDSRWTWFEAARWCGMWFVFASAVLRLFPARWLVALVPISLVTPFFFWKRYLTAAELIGMVPGLLLAQFAPPLGLAVAVVAVCIPTAREPRYLLWMDTVFLAAGAGWTLASLFKKRG